MSRANDMVYPLLNAPGPNDTIQYGITLREHFAAMAMQGLCANPAHADRLARYQAADAVAYADALLAELEQ